MTPPHSHGTWPKPTIFRFRPGGTVSHISKTKQECVCIMPQAQIRYKPQGNGPQDEHEPHYLFHPTTKLKLFS